MRESRHRPLGVGRGRGRRGRRFGWTRRRTRAGDARRQLDAVADAGADDHDEQWFWAAFELELERARRHDRSFSLTRLDLGGREVDASSAMAALADVRIGDAVATIDDRPFIMWAETDDDGASQAIRRVAGHFAGVSEVTARTVVFPRDGLSRNPLVEALDRAPADVVEVETTSHEHPSKPGGSVDGRANGPPLRSVEPHTDVVKRAMDVTIVLTSLPFFLPLLAICAVAIRLDTRGPVLFTQERTGQYGRPFRMLKFRTMVVNADEMKERLRHLSVVPAPDFKIPDDPRVTRIGRHLRATSLDELPQLWNVLRGDMSLVGPRPTSFAPGQRRYELWHTRRLEVKPGLTGLWQVEGRNTTDFDERIRLDERYIWQRSPWLDVAIMARTVPALLRREGS